MSTYGSKAYGVAIYGPGDPAINDLRIKLTDERPARAFTDDQPNPSHTSTAPDNTFTTQLKGTQT